MQATVNVDAQYVVPEEFFDREDLIAARVLAAPLENRIALRKALRYMYITDAPTNLMRDDLMAALAGLNVAEQKIAKWLQIRTNGGLRKTYGKASLLAARRAKHRCDQCGFPDVRVLNLDHVDGRKVGTAFRCLCANCHHIKSCQKDWLGVPQCGSSDAGLAVPMAGGTAAVVI